MNGILLIRTGGEHWLKDNTLKTTIIRIEQWTGGNIIQIYILYAILICTGKCQGTIWSFSFTVFHCCFCGIDSRNRHEIVCLKIHQFCNGQCWPIALALNKVMAIDKIALLKRQLEAVQPCKVITVGRVDTRQVRFYFLHSSSPYCWSSPLCIGHAFCGTNYKLQSVIYLWLSNVVTLTLAQACSWVYQSD